MAYTYSTQAQHCATAQRRATAECLTSIEAVETLADTVRRAGGRNKSALLHVLNDYTALLRVRCNYQQDPALEVRLKRVVERLEKQG